MSDLKCSICLSTFRNPRFLKCGHTFCLDCISGLRGRPQAKSICCPECRAYTDIPKGIDALPVNWLARRLIDSANEAPKVPICANHPDHAILFCKSCVSLFCAKCLKDHAIHIDDACSVDDSVVVYKELVASTKQGLSKLMAEYKTELDEWSVLNSRISVCFQEQKRVLLQDLDDAISELQKKKAELEKEVSDDQIRALELAKPQVVPFCDSLVDIKYRVTNIEHGLQMVKPTPGKLDWTALKKLMELSKMKRDEAPKKGSSAPLGMSYLLHCDETRLKELSQSIKSQSAKSATISFPSLPFTLPHVTRKTFTCIGRKSLGVPTNFEVQTAGPISWNLQAYLAGEDDDNTIALYVFFPYSTKSIPAVTAFTQVKVEFRLNNTNNEFVNARSFQYTFSGIYGYGYAKFTKIASVYCTGDSEGEISFLPTVEVTVTILGYWLQTETAQLDCVQNDHHNRRHQEEKKTEQKEKTEEAQPQLKLREGVPRRSSF